MHATPNNGHRCRGSCRCDLSGHPGRLLVVTGGPGAGKTALLEVVRRNFCEHVAVLPEAAGIVFGGGFPRHTSRAGRRSAQRAIFRVQVELERMTKEEEATAVVLCDRGTLDGLAYWPGETEAFWSDLGVTKEAELSRYAAVIHLRTPPAEMYNHQNPLRIESAREAAAIDEKILLAWQGHPRVHVIEQTPDFLEKVVRAVQIIRAEVPACCWSHEVSQLGAL